ncbi:hypothetical protein Tco_0355815 [Tanacetum coccineum]
MPSSHPSGRRSYSYEQQTQEISEPLSGLATGANDSSKSSSLHDARHLYDWKGRTRFHYFKTFRILLSLLALPPISMIDVYAFFIGL